MDNLNKLDPEIRARVEKWLSGPYDTETKAEIRRLLESDIKTLSDAFYQDLSFGTGGLRSLMGPGTNRMNLYTVQMATQGLANYINQQPRRAAEQGVLIGFDSRHHSQAFAEETAKVLAASHIPVHLLKELRPTPYVSFGVRNKKCIAGVMITASHNPKEYNGYKVYWSDGAQVVPPHDVGIMNEVHKIKDLSQVKVGPLKSPLIKIVDDSLDSDYLAAIHPLQHFPEENKKHGKELKITYTSLHGTGITLIPKALPDWGFTNITYVDEQIKPDGDFPTVKFPNPEYKEALALGIDHLTHTQSDIFIATDPDADRMGVVAQTKEGPIILNGNEIASICTHFLCETLTKQKKMPAKGAFVTTIVSTELIKKIAEAFHTACFEVLTGFKYIGEKIHLWETESGGYTFIFGAEESYGFLLGTHARDKDAIVSSCLIAEIALHMKRAGKTLIDYLNDLYEKYGVFRERQLSLNFAPGEEGMKKMSGMMQKLREHPLETLLKLPLTSVEDYEKGEHLDLVTKKKTKLTLPKSDVLLYRFGSRVKVVIRPSGTEPKLKIYAAIHKAPSPQYKQNIVECDSELDTLLSEIKAKLS